KNLFKFGFLALALSLSVAACNSEKKADGADTTSADTTMAVDTNGTDTTVAVDTTAKDTAAKH
ncbi:MAG: hypothetical protein EOO01_17900, partial [Chitinophagaceae bacterium]